MASYACSSGRLLFNTHLRPPALILVVVVVVIVEIVEIVEIVVIVVVVVLVIVEVVVVVVVVARVACCILNKRRKSGNDPAQTSLPGRDRVENHRLGCVFWKR